MPKEIDSDREDSNPDNNTIDRQSELTPAESEVKVWDLNIEKPIKYYDPIKEKKYDPNIETPKMGNEIAWILVITFAISYIVLFITFAILVICSKDPLETFLKGVPLLLMPLLGVVSTVMGFYFAKKAM